MRFRERAAAWRDTACARVSSVIFYILVSSGRSEGSGLRAGRLLVITARLHRPIVAAVNISINSMARCKASGRRSRSAPAWSHSSASSSHWNSHDILKKKRVRSDDAQAICNLINVTFNYSVDESKC